LTDWLQQLCIVVVTFARGRESGALWRLSVALAAVSDSPRTISSCYRPRPNVTSRLVRTVQCPPCLWNLHKFAQFPKSCWIDSNTRIKLGFYLAYGEIITV